MTRELLWERLRAAGIAEGDAPAPDAARSPWYVRVMLGVAGWIGALFLIGFVGVAFVALMRNAGASWILGALVSAGAASLFRAGRQNDLVAQFAFALALAGQGLMVFGIEETLRSMTATALAAAFQQALLFVLLPNFLHRVWAALTAGVALLIALAGLQLSFYGPALLAAGLAFVWLREFDYARHGELLRAAGYGMALAMLAHFGFASAGLAEWFWTTRLVPGALFHAWLGPAAGGIVLVATVAALLRREGIALGSKNAGAALGGAAVLAIASIKAPGIAPACVILILGYANGNRVLVGAGIAALIAYLSHYYYWLPVTLLDKSMILAALGAALLAARVALRRYA